MRHAILASAVALVAACAPRSPSPQPPTATSDAAAPTSAGDAPSGDAAAERKSMTAAECEAQGGKVVGDIGDGAIHRPDYVCPEGGAAPLGNIAADPGGPVAVEGAVCCGG